MTDEIEFDDELKSLIDSIEKQQKTSIKNKKIYLLVVLFCSLIVYFVLSNEQLSYNIYFICLSILRLLLIQVNFKSLSLLIANRFSRIRFFPIGIGQRFIRIHVSFRIHFITILSTYRNAV